MTILIEALLVAQATTLTPNPPVPSSTTTPKEKPICHLEDVGQTRIAQRICHTKAEWDQIERQSQDDFSSNMSKQNNPGNKPE